jgi:anti-sigma factor RsiW
MNCTDIASLTSDYVSNSLGEAIRAEIESHLVDCPTCRADVDAARDLLISLASLGGQKPPTHLWDGVYARITSDHEAKRVWWRWALRPIVAAPTAAAAALLAITLLWPSGQAPMDDAFAREYTYYIGAHYRLQRQQTFIDPDVALVRAEVQKSALIGSAEAR